MLEDTTGPPGFVVVVVAAADPVLLDVIVRVRDSPVVVDTTALFATEEEADTVLVQLQWDLVPSSPPPLLRCF